MHPNSTIAIFAGGPSLTQEAVNKCQHLISIAINDSYLLAPWATYHYFCDKQWWSWHHDKPQYRAYQGIRITAEPAVSAAWPPDAYRVRGAQASGISTDPEVVNYGKNSGYQALNVAVLMGARRIILLGYDMKIAKSGAAHWFGDHPNKVRSNYPSWLSGFSVAADQLAEMGVEVINCSPDTALTCFKQMSLESALSLEQDQALQQAS